MIWVPIVGLTVGALLAQRFTFVALLPATLAVAVLAFAVASTHASSAPTTILIIVVTTICMQAGYFGGMLLRRGVGGASRLSSFSQTTSARDTAR
jgi:hypothetical protein